MAQDEIIVMVRAVHADVVAVVVPEILTVYLQGTVDLVIREVQPITEEKGQPAVAQVVQAMAVDQTEAMAHQVWVVQVQVEVLMFPAAAAAVAILAVAAVAQPAAEVELAAAVAAAVLLTPVV